MSLRGLFSSLRGRERTGVNSATVTSPATGAADSAVAIQERRAGHRRYGDPVEVHLCSFEYSKPVCGSTGWVRDRCPNGLAFTVEKPLDIGSWLRVRPTFVPEDAAWVDVLVRHCHPQGNRWVLGCQFVESPPRELMLLFR